MKLIPFEINSGAENMRIDSQMLDDSIRYNSKEPIFRLYAWKPFCVSLGRNQKDDFLDKDFLKANNIDFVRRLTGGRALLHADEITAKDIVAIVKQWQQSVVWLDKMVYEDAKKEFSLSSMTGFGADGNKEEQVLDFEQVRGDFESNPFVTTVLKHIQVKTELGNELITRLGNLL